MLFCRVPTYPPGFGTCYPMQRSGELTTEDYSTRIKGGEGVKKKKRCRSPTEGIDSPNHWLQLSTVWVAMRFRKWEMLKAPWSPGEYFEFQNLASSRGPTMTWTTQTVLTRCKYFNQNLGFIGRSTDISQLMPEKESHESGRYLITMFGGSVASKGSVGHKLLKGTMWCDLLVLPGRRACRTREILACEASRHKWM